MMSWKTLLVGFLIGLLAGAGWGAWFAGECRGRWDRGEKRGERILQKFTRELDLTPGQRKSVGEILRRQRDNIRDMRRELGPRMEEIRAEAHRQIRALLTPEQQERLDGFKERRPRRHHNDDSSPPPD